VSTACPVTEDHIDQEAENQDTHALLESKGIRILLSMIGRASAIVVVPIFLP
jgi:hypothetical protein